MTYHRFYTPLDIFTSGDGLGKHRETCIDEITFDANGEMVIKPTLEGVSAVAMPANGEIKASYVTLNKNTLALTINTAETLSAVVGPFHTTNKALAWESSDAKIATVDNNGKVTAVAAGTATITVKTANGKQDVCAVTVADAVQPPVKVTGVSLNKKTLSLTVGKSQSLAATVSPANAADKSLKWSSSNKSVATVTQAGKVTAKKAGTATITVASVAEPSVKATCKVTVKAAVVAVKKVTLKPTKATLGVKEKLTLKATVTPSNATSKKVTWKSDKKSVATVSSKGVVTAKKTGTAKITATAGGKKATCKITVKKAPSKLTLNAKKKTVKKGKTYQLKVKLPKNTASNKITYTTSNKKVATVSSAGKVKGIKKGTATITAKTFNGKKARIKITVK